MNRRVVLTVTDGQGKVVSAGGVGDAIKALTDSAAKSRRSAARTSSRSSTSWTRSSPC